MAVFDCVITDRYALYHGDSCEVLPTLPDESIGLSIHSPPFALPKGGALYHYSSSERDLSNARTYAEFLEHYAFVVRELYRLTPPGRLAAVHCMDLAGDGANLGGDTSDFPGDLIRLYKSVGWRFAHRHFIWKEPLSVRNRTMAKELAHCQVVEDSTLCGVATADQLLLFRKPGKNKAPVAHPTGLLRYAGEAEMPAEYARYRAWEGKQTENKWSHTIWRRYASAFWYDIRLDRVLPHKEARDPEDERHCHPLQLDVIERAVVMYSNPGETVLTPCAGVGSEVYGAVINGRRGLGCELKGVYYRQALANLKDAGPVPEAVAEDGGIGTQLTLLDFPDQVGEVEPPRTRDTDLTVTSEVPFAPAQVEGWRERPFTAAEYDVVLGEELVTPIIEAGVTTCGALADRLLGGADFGLSRSDLEESLYPLVESMSASDPVPIGFDFKLVIAEPKELPFGPGAAADGTPFYAWEITYRRTDGAEERCAYTAKKEQEARKKAMRRPKFDRLISCTGLIKEHYHATYGKAPKRRRYA